MSFFKNYLESFDFDEFLEAIDDVEVAAFVVVSDISGAKPTFFVNHFLGGFGVVQLSFHHLRSSGIKFASLIRP